MGTRERGQRDGAFSRQTGGDLTGGLRIRNLTAGALAAMREEDVNDPGSSDTQGSPAGRSVVRFASLLLLSTHVACADEAPYPRYEPTPPEVVAAMLRLADVSSGDVVYDLGSGDGRIVITAVKDFGAARAVGVELDPKLIARAERNARKAGVSDRVSFVQQDLFEADITSATVVTLYLLPEVNLLLRPRLLHDLAPGTRIVSHSHDMGDWEPERTVQVHDRSGRSRHIHLWVVPPADERLSSADGSDDERAQAER